MLLPDYQFQINELAKAFNNLEEAFDKQNDRIKPLEDVVAKLQPLTLVTCWACSNCKEVLMDRFDASKPEQCPKCYCKL